MQYAKIQPNIVLRGRHFLRHLRICYPICVKLQRLVCADILHTSVNKKDRHRSCHMVKCNMLNKWLKAKKTSILITHTFTFTTIHLKHDLSTHICTNISHTRTTTYAHMHICNPPPKSGKIKCCHLANIEYFVVAIFSFCSD